ncbi:tRNA wybutosine-synthesizing protein 1 [Strigomonas culicis]|uniref:tRNA 4-demethylwyosine synthase (AdoMet-dependent) n=1 Tax=Strigomonas culicis TaxID=28005 RepID=S9V741_9TRYP|nr:tRNA wybutosine-synthesizing protein 1 [Strigomonas culicis]|eukprot:EPY22786.1 tRNA wybutosine-synthesizing protein 1 [Strigomonas culicis]
MLSTLLYIVLLPFYICIHATVMVTLAFVFLIWYLTSRSQEQDAKTLDKDTDQFQAEVRQHIDDRKVAPAGAAKKECKAQTAATATATATPTPTPSSHRAEVPTVASPVEDAAAAPEEEPLTPPEHEQHSPHPPHILIAYATYSQNTLQLAHKLYSQLQTFFYEKKVEFESLPQNAKKVYVMPKIKILELREAEEEGLLPATTDATRVKRKTPLQRSCSVDTILYDANYYLTIILTSTFSEGRAPPRSQAFELLLQDAAEDHRIDRNILRNKKFCLFSLGDIHYGAGVFNLFGKNLCRQLKQLGAPALVVPPVFSTEEKMNLLFKIFCEGLLKFLTKVEFVKKENYEALLDGFYDADNAKTQPEETEDDHVKRVSRDGGTQQDYLPALYDMKIHKAGVTSKAKRGQARDSTHAGGGYCCSDSSSNYMGSPNVMNKSEKEAAGADSGDKPCGCQAQKKEMENVDSAEEDDDDDDDDAEVDEEEDLEDLLNTNDEDGEGGSSSAAPREPRPLLYPRLQKNLEKQGYKIIGTHSAVKLCRWTKNMLRGRGGCYKFSFYNIKSYQCMEATPSLACANKCIFCWRHHTNPVAKTFLWKQEAPEFIIEEGLAAHKRMIRQMKGVPGVTVENLAAAMNVRHCALSLVGEPIMYPQINHFVELLHERRISSFMVTNAQFPEEIARLQPVVQLYLSIDAPNAVLLKEIDRPLFEDHWERCLRSIDALAKKKNTRTVFRLTLMNERNDAHIAEYVNLIQRGSPDFIEVKGVTFCGTSNSNSIDMKKNVPQHQQVIQFCQALCDELARRYPHYRTPQMEPDAAGDNKADVDDDKVIVIPPEERHRPYHVACEHEHSCCVLIAHEKFFFNHRWNTWINYDKFFDLVNAPHDDAPEAGGLHEEVEEVDVFNNRPSANGERLRQYAFTSLDYTAPTAKWATYRSQERGFDPKQTRVIRNKARPTVTATTTSTSL